MKNAPIGGNWTRQQAKNLWLQRLLSQAQAILSVTDNKLDNLSIMVDKIVEVVTPSTPECYTIQRAETMDELAELRKQVAQLTQQMQRLTRWQQ